MKSVYGGKIKTILWNISPGSIFWGTGAKRDFVFDGLMQVDVSSKSILSDYQQTCMLSKRPECWANPKWFLSILNINLLRQNLNNLPAFALFIWTDWCRAAFIGSLHRKPIKQLLQNAAAAFETQGRKEKSSIFQFWGGLTGFFCCCFAKVVNTAAKNASPILPDADSKSSDLFFTVSFIIIM